MPSAGRSVRRTYLLLVLINSVAVSLIWGINSLLLFEAGLTNTEALSANACFTLGYAVFEIPTGSLADTWGRRTSYLLGCATLTVTTLLYWQAWRVHAGVWTWAVASVVLAIGFAFFSGATEAWLVDAVRHLGYAGPLEPLFARGQIVTGAGTLAGSAGGAFLAQATDLGVPFLVRAALLLALTLVAWWLMHDIGFTPVRAGPVARDVRRVLTESLRFGWQRHSVRWVMVGAMFTTGVGYYVAFAMKPYLLDLAHDPHAYWLLGLAAALGAVGTLAGGLLAMTFQRLFRRRTSVVITGVVVNAVLLAAFGMAGGVGAAMVLFAAFNLVNAGVQPSRQAYLNDLVPSDRRATVLSFDSVVGSSGGVALQPGLGKAADLGGYGMSFVLSGLLYLLALPFVTSARRLEAHRRRIRPVRPRAAAESTGQLDTTRRT